MRLIRPPSSSPATEATMLVSSASAGVSSGRIPGRHAASSDLPAPGGPIISRLCPPAAAISSARLALSCPLTCLRSGPCAGSSTSPASGSGNVCTPFRWLSRLTRSGAAQTGIAAGPARLGPLAHRADQALLFPARMERREQHAGRGDDPPVQRQLADRDPVGQQLGIGHPPSSRAAPARSADRNGCLPWAGRPARG